MRTAINTNFRERCKIQKNLILLIKVGYQEPHIVLFFMRPKVGSLELNPELKVCNSFSKNTKPLNAGLVVYGGKKKQLCPRA